MREIVFFQMNDVLLLHQGQACENILAQAFVRYGGQVIECIIDEGLHRSLDHPFIGNMDLKKINKTTGKQPRHCFRSHGSRD